MQLKAKHLTFKVHRCELMTKTLTVASTSSAQFGWTFIIHLSEKLWSVLFRVSVGEQLKLLSGSFIIN